MATAIHLFSPEEIMAYLDGESSAEKSVAVTRHLEECLECQGLALEFRSLSQRLRGWEIEASLGALPKVEVKAKARRRSVWWPKPWALGCAALLLVGIGTTVRLQGNRTQMESMSADAPEARRHLTQMEAWAVRSLAGESATAPPAGPLIVRTARLELVSKDFDLIRLEVERITQQHQGYIGQLGMNTMTGASRSLTASLRVPVTQLDAAISELKQLGHVNSESQRGEDVTQRSVDLDARLANLRMTETRLQELLKDRTGKLGEVLEVEQAVDRTRGQIESAEAERKALSNQISFATLELSVTEEYKAQLYGDGSGATRLRNAAVTGYRNAIDGLIGAMALVFSVGPTLLIVGGVAFFPELWIRRRWLRGRREA